jgi:hypothetical protein
MDLGIPCPPKLTKEERRFKPYPTGSNPKFKQTNRQGPDADTWKTSNVDDLKVKGTLSDNFVSAGKL